MGHVLACHLTGLVQLDLSYCSIHPAAINYLLGPSAVAPQRHATSASDPCHISCHISCEQNLRLPYPDMLDLTGSEIWPRSEQALVLAQRGVAAGRRKVLL